MPYVINFPLTVLSAHGQISLVKLPSLLINNGKVNYQEKVSNSFSSFFTTIAESLNLLKDGEEDAIFFLKESLAMKFHGIKTVPAAEGVKSVSASKIRKLVRL